MRTALVALVSLAAVANAQNLCPDIGQFIPSFCSVSSHHASRRRVCCGGDFHWCSVFHVPSLVCLLRCAHRPVLGTSSGLTLTDATHSPRHLLTATLSSARTLCKKLAVALAVVQARWESVRGWRRAARRRCQPAAEPIPFFCVI